MGFFCKDRFIEQDLPCHTICNKGFNRSSFAAYFLVSYLRPEINHQQNLNGILPKITFFFYANSQSLVLNTASVVKLPWSRLTQSFI